MSAYPSYPSGYPSAAGAAASTGGSPGVTNRKPGYPYASAPLSGADAAATGAYTLERQNDAHVDRLYEKVGMLKHLAISMGDEVQDSNKLLDTMHTSFVSTEGLLGSASRRLRDLGRSGNANLWCYMTVFVTFVLFFTYFYLWRQ
ncbi:protein transport protein bet1 [Blastocladiella emersonii ATCC 22665]|nr:protein transport protein bet1 [Blastocladiella emersonii ATCC 22665]